MHSFVNDLERPVGTYLYGRRMYEVLSFWERKPDDPSAFMQDYAAIWQAADKVVYSRTLDAVSTARTRLEREFDPEAVRRMKAELDRDISIGGPELAAHAFAAGLVDECDFILSPVIVGAGKRAFPAGLRVDLELLDERRFANGAVYVSYRVVSPST